MHLKYFPQYNYNICIEKGCFFVYFYYIQLMGDFLTVLVLPLSFINYPKIYLLQGFRLLRWASVPFMLMQIALARVKRVPRGSQALFSLGIAKIWRLMQVHCALFLEPFQQMNVKHSTTPVENEKINCQIYQPSQIIFFSQSY